MTGHKELTYEVLIRIDLPSLGAHASVELVLAPEATLALDHGTVKKLRDCTLADLQQFASTLTAETWQVFADVHVGELAARPDSEITIRMIDGDGLEADLTSEVLDHVVLPGALTELGMAADAAVRAADAQPASERESAAESEESATASVPVEAPVAPTEGQAIAEQAPQTDDQEAGQVAGLGVSADGLAQDGTPASGAAEEVVAEMVTPAEEAPAPAVAEPVEEEPDIRVSEPEPAIEEREAPAAPVPTPPPGRLRILGRRRPQGHPTWTAVDILINEPAFRDAQAHAISSPDKEVAGVLVGPPPEKQPDSRYLVHITDIIIAQHTRMAGASVTYTPESWRYVNDKLAERYPDEDAVIVGWYHTHPGFGIFLSGMDQFIHQNFFTQIWHVALVLDPRSRQTGFFCWDRARSRVDQYEFPWPWWARTGW